MNVGASTPLRFGTQPSTTCSRNNKQKVRGLQTGCVPCHYLRKPINLADIGTGAATSLRGVLASHVSQLRAKRAETDEWYPAYSG